MLNNPIDTLLALNEVTEELDQLQMLINTARNANPRNEYVQLQLDRKQTDVNARRKLVKRAMLDISSRN